MAQMWFTGTAAPTSTPTLYGQTYVDTVAGIIYKSKGTSSSADWTPLASSLTGESNVLTTSTSYTITSEDAVALNPSTSGSVTLPDATTRTKKLQLGNISTHAITINTVSGQTINGSAVNSLKANKPYSFMTLTPIGGNWYVT